MNRSQYSLLVITMFCTGNITLRLDNLLNEINECMCAVNTFNISTSGFSVANLTVEALPKVVFNSTFRR